MTETVQTGLVIVDDSSAPWPACYQDSESKSALILSSCKSETFSFAMTETFTSGSLNLTECYVK